VLTRDQGIRRISTVTVGLAAASLAGTLAVGAAAWAKEASKAPEGTTGGDTTNGATPGAGGDAATPAPGGAPPPSAATQPAPNVPRKPGPTGPTGPVIRGRGPGQATSGGS
jgi:hypothetical protein